MAKYSLKNKDIDVLEFETKEREDFIKNDKIREDIINVNIINNFLLPLSFDRKINVVNGLKKWIEQRKIPTNRKYAIEILKNAGIDETDFLSYIKASFGLSLNDSYWIVPADKEYKWKDFNLYENKFSEALALSAFGIKMTSVNGFISSPEFTTNGMLAKCWHRDNNQIYLYKGESRLYDKNKEAYTEFYMAQIADILGLDYVSYDLKEFHGQIVSSCPLFTSENEGYIPFYYCLDKETRDFLNADELIKAIKKTYDNNKFDDMMTFDAIICNYDRHLGNFGMIVDNNTNKILRPAPIFDNGMAFTTYIDENKIANIQEEISYQASFFRYFFDEQLELFVQPRHIPNLQKLTQFEFKKHPYFNLDKELLNSFQKYIQERAKLALKFAYQKHNTQSILGIDYGNINKHTQDKFAHIEQKTNENLAQVSSFDNSALNTLQAESEKDLAIKTNTKSPNQVIKKLKNKIIKC